MKLRITLILFAATLLISCSFNSIYLYPTKIPAGTKKLRSTTATDTTVVSFSGDAHQPTFLKNGKNVDLDYTIESVIFKSANGNNLNGWLLKPKNKVPTITLLHFHGSAVFIVEEYQAMAPLVRQGFQVFIFDYSGYGFSEGKSTRKNVMIDGNSALTYIKSRPEVKDTKLVLYGQSLGGHLVAVVGAERQNDIDALVIEAAFSSHKDIAADKIGFIGRLLVNEKYCGYKSIRKFKKPVLVIHSTDDKVVPFKQGQKIFANANEPKEFYEIKKCHMCGPEFYADSISHKIVNMLTSTKAIN